MTPRDDNGPSVRKRKPAPDARFSGRSPLLMLDLHHQHAAEPLGGKTRQRGSQPPWGGVLRVVNVPPGRSPWLDAAK
jgi:hypothetical protein